MNERAPIIPPRLVPYALALASICTIVGAHLALPGPWTPERYFTVGGLVLNTLLGGASSGITRRR